MCHSAKLERLRKGHSSRQTHTHTGTHTSHASYLYDTQTYVSSNFGPALPRKAYPEALINPWSSADLVRKPARSATSAAVQDAVNSGEAGAETTATTETACRISSYQ